jgi:hypothetical protein
MARRTHSDVEIHQAVERGLGQDAQEVAVIAALDSGQELGQGVVGYRNQNLKLVTCRNATLMRFSDVHYLPVVIATDVGAECFGINSLSPPRVFSHIVIWIVRISMLRITNDGPPILVVLNGYQHAAIFLTTAGRAHRQRCHAPYRQPTPL